MGSLLDGPRDISVAPVKRSYNRGNTLICLADGYPRPVYQWISVATGDNVEGPKLFISDDFDAHAIHYYRCQSTNPQTGANLSLLVNFTISDHNSLG